MEGPWRRVAPGPRRNLLHHRPTLLRCRPSVSACPAETLAGVRGSRLLDRRPPHYRCPAVPGLKSPARAILTVPGSSVLPSAIGHLPSGYCVLHGGLLERHPLAASSSPVLPWLGTRRRTSRCARPQPTPVTGVLLTDFAAARQFIPARPYCLSGLRQKLYPRGRRMSTPATIDFPTSGAEVTCSESRGRHHSP